MVSLATGVPDDTHRFLRTTRVAPNRGGAGVGPMSASKHDTGKVRVGLLPADVLLLVARVLTFGAVKYGARNWEKGLGWSRIHDALGRHLLAWQMGERYDPESGLPHLGHATCCMMMLAEAERTI